MREGRDVGLVLTSKALNSAWNVQPEHENYNAHGCCVNHWYRVPVTVSAAGVRRRAAEEEDGDFGNKPSGGRFTAPFRHLDSPEELRRRREERQG